MVIKEHSHACEAGQGAGSRSVGALSENPDHWDTSGILLACLLPTY